MRVTRITVENLRAIRRADLTLGPLTVVIGPNGAGKSTLLEAAQLFAGLGAPNRLVEFFAHWGGYRACVSSGSPEPRIKIALEFADDNWTIGYGTELLGEGAGFFVETERLRRRKKPQGEMEELFSRADSVVTPDAPRAVFGGQGPVGHGPVLTIAQQPRVSPAIDALLEMTKRISLWQVHKFQPSEKVRSPQQLQPTELPLPDGSNLFSALYSLKTERRVQYRALFESLQAAVPELEELEFPLAGAGHVSLAWKQRNHPLAFYSNQLSDGILRFLWIVTVLHTVPDDSLVMFDEPELSLHPQWLMLLVSLFRKTSARTNVLVATQSAEVLRWLQPDELVIADATESGTVFTRAAEKPDLQKWLENFTLAELWTMGELGGRR
jgi:predicted ATPase